MAQWKFQYMQKEVYILSRPSTDHSIVTQYTSREKDQDLLQPPSTSEAQGKIKHLCSDAAMSERQGTVTAHQQNRKKLSFKLHSLPMKLETMSSTILLKIYHRILSTRQNQILHVLLSFQNQKKGRKLQKLQTHLHLHWRELRNSLTLQNPKVTADTPAPAPALESRGTASPPRIQKSLYEPNELTFTCKMVIKTLSHLD